MRFLILSKKENFDDSCINDRILNDVNATSLISSNCIKKEINDFLVYLYTYDMVYDEREGFSYAICDDEINFVNGLFSVDGCDLDNSLESINFALENDKLILGNYQTFFCNKNGDGYFKSSLSSFHPLFYYEDENCSILSNELKLIVDGVNKIQQHKFVESYDIDYIYEILKYGNWYSKNDKTTYRNTVFRDIKRVFEYDEIIIENGHINVNFDCKYSIPDWFERLYLDDRDKFYDWYCDKLFDYAENYLRIISKNLNELELGITGGYDSRLSLMVLSQLAPKFNLKLKTVTNGFSDHPDVIIGQKLAEALNVEWNNNSTDGNKLKYYPASFKEYLSTFYISQGDFDSHDALEEYSRKYENVHDVYQHGMDFFKRGDKNAIRNFKRWFSRRIFFSQEFFLPLFATDLEIWASFLCIKHSQYEYEEFIYEVIKRINPKLLEIPFANKKLPQTEIDEFIAEGYTNSRHKEMPYLWDYNFVYDKLHPLFDEYYNKTNDENDSILSKADINSLDYFILKDRIDNSIKKEKNADKLIKSLKRMKKKSFYPHSRTLIDMKKYKNVRNYHKLLFLMDCAAASDFTSFENMEKSCSFNMENKLIESIDETYEKIDRLEKDNEKIKKQLNKEKELNKEILSSNSWKITSIFRKLK